MPPPRIVPVVLAGFTAFLGLYATQPLLPLLMEAFGASHFDVSLTVTAPTMAVALAAPIVGRLGDRIGLRPVMVGSAFALAATTMLTATSDGLREFVAWRFVQGLFTPGVFAATIAYIHEEWPASGVGRATAAYVSGTVVGGFCGRATAGLVAGQTAWPRAFIVLGVLNLIAALVLLISVPPQRKSSLSRAIVPSARVARIFRNGQLLATFTVGLCVLFTQMAMFTYVTFHLAAEPYHLSTVALGWLFVVYLFGAAVTPLAGPLIDAYGHRAALSGALAIGACGALVSLAPSVPAVVAGLALTATGVFISHATASSYIGAVTDEGRGTAVGLYAMFYYIGGSLGGAVPAAFWERGGWKACVALVVAVQIATVTIAATFWRDRRRTEPPLPEAGV
jgi:MFS transporter, YNFM family, putative membrane transport protein